jgi:fatty acid amide hydrolase
MDPARLTQFGAVELARSIAAGDVSAREVVDAHIARIEEIDGDLNAVVIRRFDAARAEADAADAARRRGATLGPLHGVPVTIKDQFHVAGLPTVLGTPRLREHVASDDGPVVAAWRRAGAIVLGKGNVPQLLVGGRDRQRRVRAHEQPVGPERTPGGSSGGDAAIVAAGGVPLALGGDFGGSLRLPAAWCGIATLAPTARRFPTDAMPGARSRLRRRGHRGRPRPPRALHGRRRGGTARHGRRRRRPRPRPQPPVPWADPAAVDVSRLRVALIPEIAGWTPAPPCGAPSRGRRRPARERCRGRDLGRRPRPRAGGPPRHGRLHRAGRRPVPRDAARRPAPCAAEGRPVHGRPPERRPALLTRLLRGLGQERAARIVPWTHRRSAAGLLDLLGDGTRSRPSC